VPIAGGSVVPLRSVSSDLDRTRLPHDRQVSSPPGRKGLFKLRRAAGF